MRKEHRRHPDWAERERQGDLDWIKENFHVLWPLAQKALPEQGRGALFVDTTSVVDGGHPFGYFPESFVEENTDDEAIKRLVRQCDPNRELVVILLKSQERMSGYRILIRPGPPLQA